MTEITIRDYQPGDEVGILQSFNLVFREVCGPTYVDRSMEYWRWQFLANPAGHRITVAVSDDGRIAAHYAGIPYEVWLDRSRTTFAQGVDSFTHPEFRQGLKKPGLFVETAFPWFEQCRQQGVAMIYGYPVKTAERIGARYLGYTNIRVIDYLVRDLAKELTGPAGLQVELVTRNDALPFAEIDALFERCAGAYRCLLARDARYLHWRYRLMPDAPYTLALVRDRERLRGLAVLRLCHELVPGACTIADWLVPLDDRDARTALLAAAQQQARAAGRSCLLAVFPPDSAEFAALRAAEFALVPSDRYHERRLMHRSFDERLSTEWLAEHWWYTLGDSDLV